MALWTKLKEFVEHVTEDESRAIGLREEELRLASAALLVRAMVVDGEADSAERNALKAVLQRRFDIDSEEAEQLLDAGREREHEAVDLYGFTSVLARALDQDGRKRVVEMLWEVVMADGAVHEFEANMVWRVAELLGVSTRDRVLLRKIVASRYPDAEPA